jgi:predicted nucleic acid-binding protein
VRLVLDASAAVRITLRGEHTDVLLEALERAAVVAAPGLFVNEAANALWKYHRAGILSLDEALAHHADAVGLVDNFAPDDQLATEALAEASRRDHPVYDLLYAVLARRLGAAVLTLDTRLAGLLGAMGVPVAVQG